MRVLLLLIILNQQILNPIIEQKSSNSILKAPVKNTTNQYSSGKWAPSGWHGSIASSLILIKQPYHKIERIKVVYSTQFNRGYGWQSTKNFYLNSKLVERINSKINKNPKEKIKITYGTSYE